MELAKTFGKATHLIRQRPHVWLLALLAIVGDVWAVLSYDPTTTEISFNIFWFALLTLVAEVGLIHALAQSRQGKPSSFIDSIMTPISMFLPIVGVKGILLIVPALCAVILLLLSPVIMLNTVVAAILVVPMIPVLLLVQIWTFLTLGGVLVHHYSFGEAISRGWQIFRKQLRRITVLLLPFVIIDIILIASLVAVQAVTFDSAFIYEVTPEMAELNRHIGTGGPTEAGEYFSLGRLFGSAVSTALKVRGPELLSVPLFLTDSPVAGGITAGLGLVLLLLRSSTLTLAYLEFAEPVREMKKTFSDLRHDQAAPGSDK